MIDVISHERRMLALLIRAAVVSQLSTGGKKSRREEKRRGWKQIRYQIPPATPGAARGAEFKFLWR